MENVKKYNIVVIPSIIPKDKTLDKFGGWEWMDYSKKAWKFWCDKNGYELVIYDKPSIVDTSKYRITVQRWFDIFNFLDAKNIKYDQICMVDASYIPKWDCPDFFELTDNKFSVTADLDNLKWIYESIQGFKKVFGDYELDVFKYFNAGFVVFNKSHRLVFEKFKQSMDNGYTDLLPIDWQIDLGNQCNGRCVYCTPYYSSSLANEFKKIGLIKEVPPKAWTENEEAVDRFVDILKNTPKLSRFARNKGAGWG